MGDHSDIDHTGLTGVGETGTAAHIADAADAHDASAISVLDSGDNFTGTDVEAVLSELQDNIDAVSGGSSGYFSRRLLSQQGGAANVTTDLNSTSYIAPFSTGFYHDWDIFPATHFLITAIAQSSAGGATVTAQLTPMASPTNPVSAAGDDLVITNTLQEHSSGWVAVSDAMSGLVLMTVAIKGSTATVDLATRWLDIAFKIDA
jgi:hypothetical protein